MMLGECPFEIGDRVTFREWDDMAAEYGMMKDGNIDLGELLFTEPMRKLCGKTYTVKEIRLNYSNRYDRIILEEETHPRSYWAFCPEMFKDYDRWEEMMPDVEAAGLFDVLSV